MDSSVLRRVGHVLLQLPYTNSRSPRNIILADDCFQLFKSPLPQVSQAVIKSTEKLYGKQVLRHTNLGEYLSSKVSSLKNFIDKKKNCEKKIDSISALAKAMELLSRHEFRNYHGDWIDSNKPILDPLLSVDNWPKSDNADAKIDDCHQLRNEMRLALNSLLKDDGILVIPTIVDPPPKLGSKEILSETYQTRAFSLSSIASMSGCCQVSIPLGFYDKYPLSVSFVARYGGDRFLLDNVQSMHASLLEQIDIASKSTSSSNAISREESAELAKEKGNVAYKEKQWQKAANLYSEAIKLSGKNPTYHSNRAAAYLELGSFLQAEADCSTAIGLDKKNVKAYLRRGTAREMLGDYKGAIEDFKHALVLEPTNKTASHSMNRLRKLFA